ncbi:hypothetical protein CK203_085447 [Vitis vinifera]|uniref:DUF4283 domain-containing protein n=1 Tax=Vitis vinifera TaxID=29760 RepID=A0A438BUM1_VITVI|nr:hypothetical protein CK203_085447 [Vitis vinifera]
MLKVLVERKTFLIRLEGKQGGEWCSITEISRGSVFALGFEKEAVEWLVDYLTKALALKSHMGFNKKFRGKCRVHLMEVGLQQPWKRLGEYKTCVIFFVGGPLSNVLEKGRNIRWESWPHNYEGSMHRSYAKVVSDEGPEEISGEKLREERRWKIKVRERNIIQLRRWSPKENAEIDGKFKEGWIELRGLPFHLWARLKIAMRDKAILPALLEVSDGDWVFTVVVVVVGDEEGRRGGEKGESTRVAGASHSGTDGGKREESGRSTAGGRCHVGEDNRQRKEGEKGKAMITSAGKCDKGYQLPSQSCLKTDRMDGIEATEEERWAGEDEAITDVGCRACERKAQSLARPGLSAVIRGCKLKGPMGLGLSPEGLTPFETGRRYARKKTLLLTIKKGKPDPGPLEVQSEQSSEEEGAAQFKKMWSTFFPPSSRARWGNRCSSEPISRGKTKVDSEGDSRGRRFRCQISGEKEV